MLDSIKQHKKSSPIIGLLFLTALFLTITAVVNYVKPEATRPIMKFFGGKKGFALAITSIASIFLALAVLGIVYVATKSIKTEEIKDLNFVLKKALSEKIDNDVQKEEITINKDDLSITSGLGKLTYYSEIQVIAKDCYLLMIEREEESDKAVYKITGYKEWLDESDKLICDVGDIKNKLFCEDDKTLKSIIVLPITYQDYIEEDGVSHFLYNVISSYKCIEKYISKIYNLKFKKT